MKEVKKEVPQLKTPTSSCPSCLISPRDNCPLCKGAGMVTGFVSFGSCQINSGARTPGAMGK